jgi:hypothetical protein
MCALFSLLYYSLTSAERPAAAQAAPAAGAAAPPAAGLWLRLKVFGNLRWSAGGVTA